MKKTMLSLSHDHLHVDLYPPKTVHVMLDNNNVIVLSENG